MLRQLSNLHGQAAPISTKSNSCMYFILSENRPLKKTILSAFQKTGLLPFAPEIVLEQLRELGAPSPSPSPPHTPLAIRPLRRQANSLEEITVGLSPTIQWRFKTFSLVQAQFSAQALEDLAHTQAA